MKTRHLKQNSFVRICVLSFALLLGSLSGSRGQFFTITEAIGTNTPPLFENFFPYPYAPVFDGSNIAFFQAGGGGIYAYINGILSFVANGNTAFPNGRLYDRVDAPSIDGGVVAFRISHIPPCCVNDYAIATYAGGTLRIIADVNTAIPNSTAFFTGFNEASVGGGSVIFVGVGNNLLGTDHQSGIYVADLNGSIRKVVDENTPIPGGSGNFAFFSDPKISHGNVAFLGSASGNVNYGIYTDVGGTLRVVADFNTPIPGGTGNFTGFSPPSLAARSKSLWKV